MKRFLLLALIALLPLASHGETHTFRTYRVEDGLSQDGVWSVLQDSQGLMWFGTIDGSDRLDGRSSKYFRRNVDNPSTPGNNFERALREDSTVRQRVGTENGLYI